MVKEKSGMSSNSTGHIGFLEMLCELHAFRIQFNNRSDSKNDPNQTAVCTILDVHVCFLVRRQNVPLYELRSSEVLSGNYKFVQFSCTAVGYQYLIEKPIKCCLKQNLFSLAFQKPLIVR